MTAFRPSTSMNDMKAITMSRAAEHFEQLAKILDESSPDPRLAAITRTELEKTAAMFNKAIAFGAMQNE